LTVQSKLDCRSEKGNRMDMDLTVHPLSDIAAADWLPLLNHPDVRRHMPLAGGVV
jgi:hypothetical protein